MKNTVMRRLRWLLTMVLVLSFTVCSGCSSKDTGADSITKFCNSVYTFSEGLCEELNNATAGSSSEEDYNLMQTVGKETCAEEGYALGYEQSLIPLWFNGNGISAIVVKDLKVTKIDDISGSEHTYSISFTLSFTHSDGSVTDEAREGRAGTDDNGKIIYVNGLEG